MFNFLERDAIVLSDEQEAAQQRIFEALGPRPSRPFSLQGLAGTGKTTLLASVARDIPDAILCTLTGKAASVLRRKTGLPACTIHSAFYKLTDVTNDKMGRKRLHFDPTHEAGQLSGKIVLIDESSMLNHQMMRDIVSTGAAIAGSGDPGQLPPVNGEQFFDYADFTLETIHRQALESPIIRQAHAVRKGRMYAADGDGFQVPKRALTERELVEADVILCYTNPTRQLCNEFVRAALGHRTPWPRAGEPVMCLKNAPLYGVFNGAVYTLERDFNEGDSSIQIDVDEESVTIPLVHFEPPLPSALLRGLEATTSFGFGYAMTVHKAQGSEWGNVVLIDECYRPEVRKAWLYTGITRAAGKLTISNYPIGYKPPPPLPF